MDRAILNFLARFAEDPNEVDRIILSAFIFDNEIEVKRNKVVKNLLIIKGVDGFQKVQDFLQLLDEHGIKKITLETVIELFEFVVSPKEKVVTGAVYTPLNIREYIVEKTLKKKNIENSLIADISCGCAGFLITAAKFIKKYTSKSYCEIIEQNLFGLDIAGYSVSRSKLILSLLALSQNEDADIHLNIYQGNALSFDWKKEDKRILANDGFDYIVGNPPYVCSRNIDEISLCLLKNWEVTKSGHPDLYIPFFEIALKALTPVGYLGYITVNTFFKSVNGRSLRAYFSENSYGLTIIDFRNEQVFRKRNVYTCLCLISKKNSSHIKYVQTKSELLNELKLTSFSEIGYDTLDNFNGWNLAEANVISVINKIEGLDNKVFPKYSFSTGIATLKNSIYIFNKTGENNRFYFIERNSKEYKIEKSICREIINSNKVTTEKELKSLKEHIIFPYQWNKANRKYCVIREQDFINKYPEAFAYLECYKSDLATRDKGKREYETWYAYGRNQSLNVVGARIFFPHITNNPSFVFSSDDQLLFYNGEAIISENYSDLKVLKKILESQIFWYYIKNTSKPYASEYYSLGKNYMKNFSIPTLTKEEERTFLKAEESAALEFLLKKYGLTKKDISVKL